ncbi:hypothetical protein RND71_027136 [Anisodus tanguticus]|uniref:Large ribosomal subunit protein uL18c n=1 Tax=Anisodus tanguticus TaxID=243964 RepID=A0AAE1RPK0_9SOLA|nr:hypothetical protein RND71_027136 [Anisodus tanguticus]
MSCASLSLSFLHNACADSKSLTFQFRPKLVIPTRSFPVEAKAKTRREDRTARHIRIRKKPFGKAISSIQTLLEETLVLVRPENCSFRANFFAENASTNWGFGTEDACVGTREKGVVQQKGENLKGALFIKSQVYNTPFDFQVEGTPERPRLCVFRSNKHIYVQVIDDSKMHTLASASTMQKPISEEFDYSAGPTAEVAKKVGEVIAKACLEKGITKVAFDRGGYPYHGRIEALAEAARENGLQF